MTTRRDAGLRIVRTLNLAPALFEAGEYPALLELDRNLRHSRMRTVMVNRNATP
jgi:hypothetical protein